MIGVKTLATLILFALGVVAAVVFGVLAPERLASRDAGTLFFVGCLAVVLGSLIFRFWRLGEPSQHHFRIATKRDHHEAHFLGGDKLRVSLGDNHGEAFELGPWLHRGFSVGIALLFALACVDARTLGLLDGLGDRLGNSGASWCPDSPAATAKVDPNLPGCELMRRAYALGYVKSLGECAPRHESVAAARPCTRRQHDEPALHYAWRLLDRAWSRVHARTPGRGFDLRLERAGERGRAELEVLSSAPHASHHLWTNLPDPGDSAFGAASCADRYRWMSHRPVAAGASKVLEHILAQLLFEGRYEPADGSCREFHVHWGAPLDTCKRLAADPRALLASVGALSDINAVLERAGAGPSGAVVSFQCYFEGDAAAPTSTPFEIAGHSFTVQEIQVPPSPANATLFADRYDAVARLLAPGFHYSALSSEAGIPASNMQAAFAGHDFLLTRLYSLDAVDLYLDSGVLGARPDLLEVYPYERHLRNYVQLFRSQYARQRGRL